MRAKLKYLKRGFTLVELMIVVAIVGILAALAVYGVSRYVRNAKTAEARSALGRMSKDAVDSYTRESMASTAMAISATEYVVHNLCPSAPAVPTEPPKGGKYQSSPNEWKGDWECLRFSMNEPQYFQYEYKSAGGADVDTTFECVAVGDLDGDAADYSTFTIQGAIRADGEKKIATVAPGINEQIDE